MSKIESLRADGLAALNEARAAIAAADDAKRPMNEGELKRYGDAMTRFDKIQIEIRAEEARGSRGFEPSEAVRDGYNGRPEFRSTPEGREREIIIPGARELRTLLGQTDASGGYAVPNIVTPRIFDKLRSASIVFAMDGINVIEMASDTEIVPKLTSSTGVVAKVENTTLGTAAATFGSATLTAIKFGGYYEAANELLADARGDMREFIARDLVQQIASSVDAAALEGNGSGTMTGIRNLAGVNVTTLGSSSGAAVTLSDVLDARYRAEANGASPRFIICHPRTFLALRKAVDSSARFQLQPDPSHDAPREIFGLRVVTSNQISIAETVGAASNCSWLAVVDPSQLVLGRRLLPTILIDPYSASTKDCTVIRATARFGGVGLLATGGVEIVAGIKP